MYVHDILRDKGNQVYVVSPRATLAEAVQRLVEHNIGSLVVVENGAVVGIITERDILKACAVPSLGLEDPIVAQHMTTRLHTASMNDEVTEVMGMMTQHRVRHLPVLDGNRLLGMISIGDLVKSHHDQLCVENHFLLSYIQS